MWMKLFHSESTLTPIFVLGIGKSAACVKILLAIEKVLSAQDTACRHSSKAQSRTACFRFDLAFADKAWLDEIKKSFGMDPGNK
jgi:hypothetical protein